MYAKVILPQKVGEDKDELTYRVPADLKTEIGQIVEVPLRNKRIKGVILSYEEQEPPYKTRDIFKIVENAPHLKPWQVELMRWIAAYYFSPLFRALKLFLPVPFVKKKTLQNNLSEELAGYEFNPRHSLSEDQKSVLERFEKTAKTVSLLHGITGSGKTEIYLHIANKCLREGHQVLLLVPEISLTPQTLRHFTRHFTQKIAVIHSQLTGKEKEREWMSIFKGDARIIIGSRSALFAPFTDLGCIMIDEEHDSSYKQDQSPRYNTLHVAEQMAKMLNIKILTGSATPTIETYFKAKNGQYELLELENRIHAGSGGNLPITHVVDLREEIKKKNFSIFSELLRQKIGQKLENNEQSILFLNRRGAASAVICRECGYVSKCNRCDVPMTYHNRFAVEDSVYHAERLICHHCGRIEKVPHLCPTCQSHYIRYIGLGTQRVEEELNRFFPSSRTLRADRDTTGKKDSFKAIYETFLNQQADILIGTQMIAFGLHIPKVNLVGIVLADLGLTIPNFRSSERTFQLITQVAGRAGREKIRGEVVIQTYLPNHYAIRHAAAHDYKGFYEQELALRKNLKLPPYGKLIKLTFSDPNNKTCLNRVLDLYNEFKPLNSDLKHQITYYPALIPKLRNKYRWHILISGPEPAHLLKQAQNLRGIVIDVDPLSTV